MSGDHNGAAGLITSDRSSGAPLDPTQPAPSESASSGSGARHSLGPARKAALAAGVVVVALLGLFIYGVANVGNEDGAFAPSPLDGELAPPLHAPTMDGGRYSLDADRGRWVVVNFFATWCPPCIQEHPELVKFSERHAADGQRKVVSVVFGGAAETDGVRAFFAANGGDWPVVVDPTGTLSVDYAVPRVPESILVSPTGLVLGKIRGGVTADELDAIIDNVERSAINAAGGTGQ
ncbi:MAG: TlpA family protein disulfide reductase [Acidimicrobiales bacterium]